MALFLHGHRLGDSDDDDGSVAGTGESKCPQREDIMLLIRLGLFVKDDYSVLIIYCSSPNPSMCIFARERDAERLLRDIYCK